ncbi:MAG: hypothetical protein ACYCZB_02090 [Acidiphilium sp.]
MRDPRFRFALIAGMAIVGATLAGCSSPPPTSTTTTTEQSATGPVMAPANPLMPPATVTTTTRKVESQTSQ